MSNPVPSLLSTWRSLRAELRAAEEASHPDVYDGYGRRWVWKDGDLYIHDGLLAVPFDLIQSWGLPTEGLADRNPNYAGLCAICRHEQPPGYCTCPPGYGEYARDCGISEHRSLANV